MIARVLRVEMTRIMQMAGAGESVCQNWPAVLDRYRLALGAHVPLLWVAVIFVGNVITEGFVRAAVVPSVIARGQMALVSNWSTTSADVEERLNTDAIKPTCRKRQSTMHLLTRM